MIPEELLEIHRSACGYLWCVVNAFDGVVVAEFYTKWDAEDFARSEHFNELARIQREYDIEEV